MSILLRSVAQEHLSDRAGKWAGACVEDSDDFGGLAGMVRVRKIKVRCKKMTRGV